MKAFLVALLCLISVVGEAQSRPAQQQHAKAKKLTLKQAEELALNVPYALEVKKAGGCPKANLLWVNDKQLTVFFQVRNPCDKGHASDLVGNFTVDLNNGEVWNDVDRRDDGRNLFNSPQLEQLRRKFLGNPK